jgi:hypothetical protein
VWRENHKNRKQVIKKWKNEDDKKIIKIPSYVLVVGMLFLRKKLRFLVA